MDLQIVSDDKNDKTEESYEYVHNKRTREGTCVLFCARLVLY